jgi:hypothetical protein
VGETQQIGQQDDYPWDGRIIAEQESILVLEKGIQRENVFQLTILCDTF